MKRILMSVIGLISCFAVNAQEPISWEFTAKKTADKTYEVHLTATIDEPWHIYSQQTPEGGPLPTKIGFLKNPIIVFDGKVKEVGDMERYHEDIFGVDVYAYSKTVDFVQIVKLKSNVKTNVSGTLEFMVCTRQQCLTPQTLKFSVKLQ